MEDFHTQIDKLDHLLIEIKKFVRHRSTEELKSNEFKQLLQKTNQQYKNIEKLWQN